jgi:hypothetical protein
VTAGLPGGLYVKVHGEADERAAGEHAVGRVDVEGLALFRDPVGIEHLAGGLDPLDRTEEGGQQGQRVDADIEPGTDRVEGAGVGVPRLDAPVVHLGEDEERRTPN